MKLKVYQQGGGLIYTPFIPEQWLGQGSRSSGSEASSSEAKLDPLDKELISLMKDQNLLPSDIQMIYNKLIQFQRKSRELMIDGDYRSAMPGMLQIMQLASVAKANKEHWDNALTEIKKHDAGSEVALDSYGKMWVRDREDGKITKVSPDDYSNERYAPISNSELMFLRQRNPEFAFSDEILDTVTSDIVGQKDIRQEIDTIISNFGNVSKDQFAVGSKIKELAGDVIDGDIYKISSKYSKADLYDFSSLLFSQLSRDAQNLLRARAAMSGTDPQEYLRKIIFSQVDREEKYSYEASASKAAGGGGSGDDEDLKTHNTYQYRFGLGKGTREQFLIAPTASKIHEKGTYLAQGEDWGPMLNWDMQPLDPMNLQKMFFSSGKDGHALSSSVNTQDITFGDHPVTESERPTIFYNGGSGTSKVYLPWKDDNGHIRPDFEKLREFNAFMKDVKDSGNMRNLTPTERNAMLAKYPKLSAQDVIPSEDGKSFTLRDTRPFLAFSAFAGDDTINLTKDEKLFLRKVDKSEAKKIKDVYNNYVRYDKAYGDKKKDSLNRKYAESESGDFWEGIVFVYAKDSAWYGFNSTMDEAISKEETRNVPERVMANDYLLQATEEARANPRYDELSRIGQHF